MDISQENVEADSISCPESDSLLPPSTGSSRPPAVEDLPQDPDDAISASVATAASRPEALAAKDLEALSIDVVESWRIVAPAAPMERTILATAGEGRESGNKSDFVSPASESGAFDVYR